MAATVAPATQAPSGMPTTSSVRRSWMRKCSSNSARKTSSMAASCSAKRGQSAAPPDDPELSVTIWARVSCSPGQHWSTG